jgi:hypothetical protein
MTGNVGPNPRITTFLGCEPVMMKPAIRTLLPVPTASRVEMFARRTAGGPWASAPAAKRPSKTGAVIVRLKRNERNTRLIYVIVETSPAISFRAPPHLLATSKLNNRFFTFKR